MFSFDAGPGWSNELSQEDAARAILALGILWEVRLEKHGAPATIKSLKQDLVTLLEHRQLAPLHLSAAIGWVRENPTMVHAASDFARAWHEVDKGRTCHALVEPDSAHPRARFAWPRRFVPLVEEFLEFVWENRLGVD